LSHADQRVRMKAQFELVRRNAGDVLRDVAAATERPQLARMHAIWGLGQLWRAKRAAPETSFLALLRDADVEVRALAARVLGDSARDAFPSDPAVRELLRDPEPRPRFFAAIALGSRRDATAVPELIEYLARDSDDP